MYVCICVCVYVVEVGRRWEEGGGKRGIDGINTGILPNLGLSFKLKEYRIAGICGNKYLGYTQYQFGVKISPVFFASVGHITFNERLG